MSLEECICQSLRPILEPLAIGDEINASEEEFLDVLSGLEYFLPATLAEIHPYWKGVGLDGFEVGKARKIGPNKMEFAGLCWLLATREQDLVPVHVRLRLSSTDEKIDWLECRLGESGSGRGGMKPRPKGDERRPSRFGIEMNSVDWAYKVTFGDEYPSQTVSD